MKFRLITGLCLLSASPAFAEIGKIDIAPAATLLLPYFEVDLDDNQGANAVVTLQNSEATAILAHAVVYTDYGVPVFNFDMYLTGYDIQTIDMGMVMRGVFPRTASAGQDPTDGISPRGPLSQDINFASCYRPDNPVEPYGYLPRPDLSPASMLDVRAAFLGAPVIGLGSACASKPRGDSIARGYMTIDTVNHCLTEMTNTSGYFLAGGGGSATLQNYMLGDVLWLDPATHSVSGASLVHLEANSTNALTTTSGAYTFYARSVSGTAADNREPLGSIYGIDYQTGNTELIVWRDSGHDPFACAGSPAWYPLGHVGIDMWDDQESYFDAGAVSTLGAAVNRVRVDAATFGHGFESGHLQLNLNTTVSPGVALTQTNVNQAYVMAFERPRINPEGHLFAVQATELDNLSQPTSSTLTHPFSEVGCVSSGPCVVPNFAAAGGLNRAPAGTLLFPYFEVSLSDENDVDTVVRVTNESASAAMGHVTLWSDRGVPVTTFDTYLTGYDHIDLDLRLLFQYGYRPYTGDDGTDTLDLISPQGVLSQDINYGVTDLLGCDAVDPLLPAAALTDLRAAFAGAPIPGRGGLCASTPVGDGIARGYITIDTASTCSTATPTAVGYTSSSNLNFQQQLSGHYLLQNRNDRLVYAGDAVQLKLDANQKLVVEDGKKATFYGAVSNYAANGERDRESLSNRWYTRFINSGATGAVSSLAGGTEYLVWREPEGPLDVFACGAPPADIPLQKITQWDEQEHFQELTPTGLGKSTQRIDAAGLGLSAIKGSLYFDLSAPTPGNVASLGRQAHLTTLFRVPGTDVATTLTASPATGGVAVAVLDFSTLPALTEGSSGVVHVRLAQRPLAYATAAIQTQNGARLLVNGSADPVTLNFYNDWYNWAQSQDITLSAVNDSVAGNSTSVKLTITFTSEDPNVNGRSDNSPAYAITSP